MDTKPVATKDDHSVNGSIGAFAGSLKNGTSLSGQYFGIINEVKREETKDGKKVEVFDHYLGALGDTDDDNITEIDLDAQSYESFVGGPTAWTKAEPHDTALGTYYQDMYNLRGISRLVGTTGTQTSGAADVTEPIVYTHYGDWPAPEIFVINAGTSGGSTEGGNAGTGS